MAIAVALPVNAKIKISGKVTDETNNPIEFATVRIQGTALGTATNDKGEYELSVADTDTLMVIFSCIGYEEVKRRYIKPTGNLTINAKLDSRYIRWQNICPIKISFFRLYILPPL